MARETVDFGDFCREWEIFDSGDHHWTGIVDNHARFVIARSKRGYSFVPIVGVGRRLRRIELETVEGRGCGGYHEGAPLAGALKGVFGGVEIWFTLNRMQPDAVDFVISLSFQAPDCPDDGDELRNAAHGGPHGRDN